MALLKFFKTKFLNRKYLFENGKVYEVQERIAIKYCDVQGIAARLKSLEEGDVISPNPAAELVFAEPIKRVEPPRASVSKVVDVVIEEESPEPEPEVEEVAEEVVEETAPTYEVRHRGGPWYDVVDTLTGEPNNATALRIDDAKALLNELVNESDESTGGASDS